MGRFFDANLAAGCRVLDIVDAIDLGVPDEPHIVRMLEQFTEAAKCAKLVAEMSKKDVPKEIEVATKWLPQDDSFGMSNRVLFNSIAHHPLLLPSIVASSTFHCEAAPGHEPLGCRGSYLARTLREESILNLGEFHGCGAFLVVITHMINASAYGIAPHQPSIVGPQQFGRHRHIPHPRIEP